MYHDTQRWILWLAAALILALAPIGCTGGGGGGTGSGDQAGDDGGGDDGGGGGDDSGGDDGGGDGDGGDEGGGDGDGGDDGGGEPEYLTVLEVSPGEGAVLVDPATLIVITFSEPVDEATVSESTISVELNGQPVAGTLSVDEAMVTFTPDEPLAHLWEFDGNVSAEVAGLSGNSLETDFIWSFTTATYPMLVGGGWHLLALKADGTVWSWGFDSDGQLGLATLGNADVAVPTQVCAPEQVQPCTEVLDGVIAVAAADEHSLALKRDGTVWAWGVNSEGELGNGTYEGSTTPVQVIDPADASGFLTGVTAIAANYYTSAALKGDGTVWTWGDNVDDKLGHDSEDWHTPNQVLGPGGTGFLEDVEAIAMGAFDMHALRSNNTLWGWGNNSYGEIGNGSDSTEAFPVQAAAPAELPDLFSQVRLMAAGAYQLLVLAEDGTLWGIGDNVTGELGIGSGIPTTVFLPACESQAAAPCSVADSDILEDVVSVATGNAFTVVVLGNGDVMGFGYNGQAGIGDGTTTGRNKPQPTCVTYGEDCEETLGGAVGAAATQYYAGFALYSDGSIWSWGTDYHQEIARDGTDVCNSNLPCGKTAAEIPGFSLLP